jgi:hypothetical protein
VSTALAPAFDKLGIDPSRGSGKIRCPAHDDRNPSLSWRLGDDGRLLVNCHSGCTAADVAAAVGADMSDMFRPDLTMVRSGEPEATYQYRDAAGHLAYVVKRWPDKHFTMHKPDGSRIGDTPRVPYRLPELLAEPKRLVVVVEGEKDADRLTAAGFLSTTSAGGAGRWDASWAPYFEGRPVVVLPDNDEPGRDHAAKVAESMVDVAAEIRVVDLPNLPAKGDVSDWLAAGHTADELRDLIRATPATAKPTIGARTAADLRHGLPPDQLADPFLTPEGATVVYARGGTGKGITACWLIMRILASGHAVMVLDYEGHEREWGSRLRGLGLTDDDLARVHYRAPYGPDWTAPTGPLSLVAESVREDAARLGVTYLVVDSYSPATTNGDTMGGEAAAREYFGGLTRIGLPSLTIAHVKGDAGSFPDRPFGSVFVHNYARETWAIERIRDEPDHDPDLLEHGPNVVSLELRNKKANGRAKAAPAFVAFSFHRDGSITVDSQPPRGRNLADLIASVLVDGPMTTPQIAAAIKEDTGESVDVQTIGRTMRRLSQRFEQVSTKRPHHWAVRT